MHHSFIAAFRSRATSRNSSSSFSSVRFSSPPPSSNSFESCFFDSMSSSIFSSTVPRHTNLDQHVLGLTDAEGPVGGLVLDCRIPPAIEVHDVRRSREVQPRPAGLERQHEERNRFVLLKTPNQIL